VKRLEAANEQLKLSTELIDKQKAEIASLEKRDEYRLREIDALKRAVEAETAATTLQRERADNAEKKVSELAGEVEKAKKRGNTKAIVAFVAGAALVAYGGHK
jgi:non-homologous end joining protein Ku